MDVVKVRVVDLHRKVVENRAGHKEQFEKAFVNYRAACIKALEDNLAAFKSGRAARIHINEAPPEDHTKDYDRVIGMLQMSTEEVVEITAQAYEQYVLDEWHWKDAWTMSNTKYLRG